LRLASSGFAVSPANTHPFVADGSAFVHNGYIPHSASLLRLLPDNETAHLKGETDSERYFAVLRTHSHGRFHSTRIQLGITALTRIANPFSLNCLLLTEDSLTGIAWHRRPGDPGGEAAEGYKTPDYYDMSYMYKPESFVVASGGWQNEGWTQLPNQTGISLSPLTLNDFFTFPLMDGRSPDSFNSVTRLQIVNKHGCIVGSFVESVTRRPRSRSPNSRLAIGNDQAASAALVGPASGMRSLRAVGPEQC
jgi:hypothetical protein